MPNIINMENVRKVFKMGKTSVITTPPEMCLCVGDYILFERIDDNTIKLKRVNITIKEDGTILK